MRVKMHEGKRIAVVIFSNEKYVYFVDFGVVIKNDYHEDFHRMCELMGYNDKLPEECKLNYAKLSNGKVVNDASFQFISIDEFVKTSNGKKVIRIDIDKIEDNDQHLMNYILTTNYIGAASNMCNSNCDKCNKCIPREMLYIIKKGSDSE